MATIKYPLAFALAGLLSFFLAVSASAQEKEIKWLSIEEAEALNRQQPKKVFVSVYTDWCSWCRRMDATTYTHPVIVDYINEHFYAVKLNAEQTEPITFRGREYLNRNAGQRRSAHDFAIALLQGKMGYPSVAFFDERMNLITAMSGFRPPERMEPVLVFFSEDVFLENPDLDAFVAAFEGSIN